MLGMFSVVRFAFQITGMRFSVSNILLASHPKMIFIRDSHRPITSLVVIIFIPNPFLLPVRFYVFKIMHTEREQPPIIGQGTVAFPRCVVKPAWG